MSEPERPSHADAPGVRNDAQRASKPLAEAFPGTVARLNGEDVTEKTSVQRTFGSVTVVFAGPLRADDTFTIVGIGPAASSEFTWLAETAYPRRNLTWTTPRSQRPAESQHDTRSPMSTSPEITPTDPGDRAMMVEALATKLLATTRQRTLDNGVGGDHKVLNAIARAGARRLDWSKSSEKTRDDYRRMAEVAIEHLEALHRASSTE